MGFLFSGTHCIVRLRVRTNYVIPEIKADFNPFVMHPRLEDVAGLLIIEQK